ncbi:MAG: [acyl-carrier-protein] S-malonyltransferase, partial [Cyclobacteriaceae bacterium]
FMQPAEEELKAAIEKTAFHTGSCPIYQNYTAEATTDTAVIQKNLIAQLTAPVRWTQTMHNMIAAGATELIECGPGKVLQGLIKKVDRKFQIASIG